MRGVISVCLATDPTDVGLLPPVHHLVRVFVGVVNKNRCGLSQYM